MSKSKSISWMQLIVIAAAAFIGALDATFMNVSMSQVVIDLDTDLGTIQKMVSFYTLITASLLLISARLQDIIGKREIFLLGMIIYGVGDLIAALSPNAMVLDKNTKLCVLLVAVSIAAFLAFEIFELRYSEAGKAPLFDVRLLKNRNLRNGTLVRLITSFVMAGTLFALSVFLLSVLKLSAFETGLMLMPMTVGMMLAIALIML